jgi:hypothetical protein
MSTRAGPQLSETGPDDMRRRELAALSPRPPTDPVERLRPPRTEEHGEGCGMGCDVFEHEETCSLGGCRYLR